MRWSIRNQILAPIIAIQAVAVTSIALATARLAADRSGRQIADRLHGVIETLTDANFPYTAGVLAKMRGLSGAHFAALTPEGRVDHATLPGLDRLPEALRAVGSIGRLHSLGGSPTLVVGGDRYFAIPLTAATAPRGPSLLVLYPETSWRRARWEAATPPLALGFGSLALMAAVTSWTAHCIGARIRTVQRQVARLAAGDFAALDPGPRDDEVRDLAGSINLLGSRLDEMCRAMGRSERSRLLAQLAAGLAHQLRNSLTGARMSVQLHLRRFPPRPGDQSLEVALRQLALTEEQVKGLLSLGRDGPRPSEHCDLGLLLDEVAFLVRPACQHAGVALDHRCAGGPFPLVADPSGLRAAVLNLALNAVEAVGRGGRVRLEVLGGGNGGESLAVEVADTGPGPPAELAQALCEPFVTSKPEGVGLGLAIARGVAAEHGGQLSWCRRNGETRFRLELPVARPSREENVAWAVS